MTAIESLLLGALAVPAALLLLPVVSEVVSLLRLAQWRKPVRDPQAPPQALLFLVLAHDEELLIADTVRSLLSQRVPGTVRRVLVVADNCSDRTAAEAAAAGAEVWERLDTERRGKPYAIAWALGQLDLSLIDAVLIIDADTQVSADFARQLEERGPLRRKVLQPYIDVRNPGESALTRMASVHGRVSHGLAYRVKEYAGLNVPLGVGMCLGTDVLQEHRWRAFSIAEDWELYCQLTVAGVRIEPVAEARISAQEAKSLAQSAPQRHRWLAGKLGVLRTYTIPLLRSPHITFPQRLDAVAELTVPGPAVHLAIGAVGIALAALLGGRFGVVVACTFGLGLLRTAGYTLAALWLDPQPLVALRAFLFLPIYAVWRVGPAIQALLAAGSTRWVRTARHVSADGRNTPSLDGDP